MFGDPILDLIDSALTDVIPRAIIDVGGDWSSRTRRSHASEAQVGSGSGPFVDVVDHVWEGHLTGAVPFTGMALLRTETGVYWAKAARASRRLPIRVSLHTYAGYAADRRTFAVGLGDTILPGVPARASADHLRCLVIPDAIPIGRVVCVARTEENAFFVVLFQDECVKFGRNRLWRLRDVFAARLPPEVRELMTRRRAGALRLEPPS